ncbi:hypothetical protein BKA69DRAFT_598343 [Paraphysoderma sedebokerense]|nr:hypothetical protein BKA69DRAFT_598343 [Paraphysoderma sedebokerense]
MTNSAENSPIESPSALLAARELYANFEITHSFQLQQIGLPTHLWKRLYRKLNEQVFDAGSVFELRPSSGGSASPYSLFVTKEGGIEKNSDVYVVDHAWTTSLTDSVSQIKQYAQLQERLASLCGVTLDDDTVVEAVPSTQGNNNCSDGNKVQHLDDLEQYYSAVYVVMKNANVDEKEALRLLRKHQWEVLNAIVEATFDEPDTSELQKRIEMQMSINKPTTNVVSTPFYSMTQYSESDDGEELRYIDLTILLPPKPTYYNSGDISVTVTESHLSIKIKRTDQFSELLGGQLFSNIRSNETTWTVQKDVLVVSMVKKNDNDWDRLFLHQEDEDRGYIKAGGFDSNKEDTEEEKQMWKLIRKAWRHLETYQYFSRPAPSRPTQSQSFWYINDEVGSSIPHSIPLNVRLSPFLFRSFDFDPSSESGGKSTLMGYSLLWPIEDLKKDDKVVRDLVPSYFSGSGSGRRGRKTSTSAGLKGKRRSLSLVSNGSEKYFDAVDEKDVRKSYLWAARGLGGSSVPKELIEKYPVCVIVFVLNCFARADSVVFMFDFVVPSLRNYPVLRHCFLLLLRELISRYPPSLSLQKYLYTSRKPSLTLHLQLKLRMPNLV